MPNPETPIVDTRNASDEGGHSYLEHLQKMKEGGTCPFCPGTYEESRTLHKEGNWRITKSSWPYSGARHHLLIIGEEHKTSPLELSAEDFLAVQTLWKWAIKKFDIAGGGLAIRFGETLYSGATICHLHFHIIMPEKNSETSVHVINFPIG